MALAHKLRDRASADAQHDAYASSPALGCRSCQSRSCAATSNADAKKEPSLRSEAGDYELRDGSVTHSQCRIVNAN